MNFLLSFVAFNSSRYNILDFKLFKKTVEAHFLEFNATDKNYVYNFRNVCFVVFQRHFFEV